MTFQFYQRMSPEAQNAVTVVIPTLGGTSLMQTITKLNQGTIQPAEILVCIPRADAKKITSAILDTKNVKILETKFRGQVPQRIYGFTHATHDIVMQLDDDIWVDARCIEQLVNTLNTLGPKIAVAPALMNRATGLSVYKKLGKNSFVSSIYYWFMNGTMGYSPGCIDKSGSTVGIDPSLSKTYLNDVEWLPGGCVLHYKKNLILENFWLLSGKAYYEDAVHSCILKSEGIRLVTNSLAKCSLETFNSSSLKTKDFFTDLYLDYLGRRYFIRRFSRFSFRVYFFYFFKISSYAYRRIALFLFK